jgi:hypothetical protein
MRLSTVEGYFPQPRDRVLIVPTMGSIFVRMSEPNSTVPRIELIEREAYEAYLARNREVGRKIEHWLDAEKDLIFESVEAEAYFRSAD